MYWIKKTLLIFGLFITSVLMCKANNLLQDTLPNKKTKDSLSKLVHDPKIALKRSAILPGLGQVYNKQAWKIPIIYGALGVTTYIFVDNLKTYKDIRFAVNARTLNDSLAITQIKDYLKNIDLGGLKLNRRKFRQSVDYSVLFFLGFWGLNVADAVVFAHLKNFDVSDNISGNIKIGKSEIANTTGLHVNFDIHKKKTQKLFVIK